VLGVVAVHSRNVINRPTTSAGALEQPVTRAEMILTRSPSLEFDPLRTTVRRARSEARMSQNARAIRRLPRPRSAGRSRSTDRDAITLRARQTGDGGCRTATWEESASWFDGVTGRAACTGLLNPAVSVVSASRRGTGGVRGYVAGLARSPFGAPVLTCSGSSRA